MQHVTTMNDEHVLTLTKQEYEMVADELGVSGELVMPSLFALIVKVKDDEYQRGYETASRPDPYAMDSFDGGSWTDSWDKGY